MPFTTQGTKTMYGSEKKHIFTSLKSVHLHMSTYSAYISFALCTHTEILGNISPWNTFWMGHSLKGKVTKTWHLTVGDNIRLEDGCV